MNAEGLVRVQSCTRCLRILRDELQIGEGRQRGDDERQQERQPDDASDGSGHGSRDGIDPGAQDVANNEKEQELGSQDTFELRFSARGRCVIQFVRSPAHYDLLSVLSPFDGTRRPVAGLDMTYFTLDPPNLLGNSGRGHNFVRTGPRTHS